MKPTVDDWLRHSTSIGVRSRDKEESGDIGEVSIQPPELGQGVRWSFPESTPNFVHSVAAYAAY